MDTREKILPLATLRATVEVGEWTVVVGLFDPLTLEQARRLSGLREKGRKLAAIVIDQQGTFLPADARANLIAALRAVDLVAISDLTSWSSNIPAGDGVEVVEDWNGEQARSSKFAQFVLARHLSSSA